jgi:hypothetical protein
MFTAERKEEPSKKKAEGSQFPKKRSNAAMTKEDFSRLVLAKIDQGNNLFIIKKYILDLWGINKPRSELKILFSEAHTLCKKCNMMALQALLRANIPNGSNGSN